MDQSRLGNLQGHLSIHRFPAVTPKDQKGEQLKKQEPVLKKQEGVVKKQAAVAKPNKPLSGGSGPGRPTKPGVGQYQTKPQQNDKKMRSSGEIAVLLKLEASKRKFQKRYQEAENAKRQRSVQNIAKNIEKPAIPTNIWSNTMNIHPVHMKAKVFSRFETLRNSIKNYTIEAIPDDRSGVLQQGKNCCV